MSDDIKLTQKYFTDDSLQALVRNIKTNTENAILESVPDWNQSDETAKDYIKNRTHYITGALTYRIPDDSTGLPYSEAMNVYKIADLPQDFTVEKYLGVQHTITSTDGRTWSRALSSNDGVMIGDGIRGAFLLVYNTSESFSETGVYIADGWWGGTVSLDVELVKQLDEKFIPGSIARITDITDSEAAINDKITDIEKNIGTETVSNQIQAAVKVETDRASFVEQGINDRLKIVEDDYLTSADKMELTSAIDTAKQDVKDTILGYLADEVINEDFDTLKEVAAWIESDTTNSAQLITRVTDIEKDYLAGADKTELEGKITEVESLANSKASQSDFDTAVARITVNEEFIDSFEEITEEEIQALFE